MATPASPTRGRVRRGGREPTTRLGETRPRDRPPPIPYRNAVKLQSPGSPTRGRVRRGGREPITRLGETRPRGRPPARSLRQRGSTPKRRVGRRGDRTLENRSPHPHYAAGVTHSPPRHLRARSRTGKTSWNLMNGWTTPQGVRRGGRPRTPKCNAIGVLIEFQPPPGPFTVLRFRS